MLPAAADMSPSMRTSAEFIDTNRAFLSLVASFGALADALCSTATPTATPAQDTPVVMTLAERAERLFCAPRAARAKMVPRIDKNGRFAGCPVLDPLFASAGAQLPHACCPPAQSASVEAMWCPYGCRAVMASTAAALGSSCFESVRRLYYGPSAVASCAGALETAWTTLIGSANCSGGFGVAEVPVPVMPGAHNAGAAGSVEWSPISIVVALLLHGSVL